MKIAGVSIGSVARNFLRITMTIGRCLLIAVNPFEWRRAIHRVATPSTAICLLALISSLNFIWGYPWVGLFAATLSIFVVGWGVNRIMAPRFEKIVVEAPLWIAAGSQGPVRLSLRNARSVPSLNLVFELSKQSGRREGEFCEMIAPGSSHRFECQVDWPKRGLHPLPKLVVESFFPFHLFRNRQWIDLDTTVAVAPRPLDHEENPSVDSILATINGLIQRWKSGDSMHYLGSREYQVGMPVRRWDFASWARLGIPIVREFGMTSTTSIRLIIDTAARTKSSVATSLIDAESLERLLSLAVLAIETILQRSVAIDLLVTFPKSNAPNDSASSNYLAEEDWNHVAHAEPRGDLSDLMIRLALAVETSTEQANARLAKWNDDLASSPTLVLSRRSMPEGEVEESVRNFVWIEMDGLVYEKDSIDRDRSSSIANGASRTGVFA